jgi:class 3 adenylate cyclase
MTREKALEQLRALAEARRKPDGTTDPEWLEHPERLLLAQAGEAAEDVIAFLPTFPTLGVRLSAEGEPIIFLGALGKFVPLLGLPKTPERILGSTWYGRYQEFDKGIAIWEVLKNEQGERVDENGRTIVDSNAPVFDRAYPVVMWHPPKRGRSVNVLTAFLDLRRFTTWSEAQDGERGAEQIQRVVAGMEQAFQDAFPIDSRIFVKGVGDGLMIVSESAEHAPSKNEAVAFCAQCARAARLAGSLLREMSLPEIQVGCGIATGDVSRVYILGRFDYMGKAINRASKLQGDTYDQACIDDGVANLLSEDPATLGEPVEVKGIRGWLVTLERLESVS